MNVEDRSPRFGTPPSIATTPQGDVIPLLFVDGIPILRRLLYPMDAEVISMRRIHLIENDAWDPGRYD